MTSPLFRPLCRIDSPSPSSSMCSSLRAFFKFAKFLAVDEYRRVLPPGPCYVARIVAVRDEDCGTCVQIAVNQAKKAGVPAEQLRAVLDGNPDGLPEELRDVYRFAE